MKKLLLIIAVMLCFTVHGKEKFPDGTTIPEWFYQAEKIDIATLGTQYRITDHGVSTDSNMVQTAAIQAVIDKASAAGGGVIVVPQGTFLSGSLFFKPGTHLHLEEGATLKGSDDIRNFAIVNTRVEGQSLKYFAALVNADGLDGFTITGKGTINGNGQRYWESFWLRRKVIPKCTNMDEMRPRLIYISNCKNVQLQDARFMNSPFWTTHLYRCENVKVLGLYIFAPSKPVGAPSSDAIDVDVCTNVLIKNCYFSVNDDAIALKGGKGPFADEAPENGGNYNIIIEDCEYGYCHSSLTCGSESIHDRNVILRRCKITKAGRLLWLKMRPDTPQKYEYITVEDIEGNVGSFIYVKPWTQFFDLKGRKDKPYSYSNNITMRNIKLECSRFFDISASEDYFLTDFTFENIDVTATKDGNVKDGVINGLKMKNVVVNGEKLPNRKK